MSRYLAYMSKLTCLDIWQPRKSKICLDTELTEFLIQKCFFK